jgi:E3 ubiquitin-protein ligase BRE1
MLSDVIAKVPHAAPDALDLQNEITRLLAAEKAHIQRFEKTRALMDDYKERCEDYKYKWGIAKTQLAKAQSQTTQYLEWQTKKLGLTEAVEPVKTNGEKTNGEKEHDAPAYDEFEADRKAFKAEAAKVKEQLEALEEENSKLNAQLTAANAKFTSLTDDDYAKTDLFITLKAQHDDVIKRINHLEATNTQLREEAQKLQAERSAYRLQVDEECRTSCSDMEGRMAHLEEDVQRLRSERDNAHMTKTMLESSQAKHDESLAALKSINAANEERVKTLESEIQRLRIQVGEDVPPPSIDQLSDLTEEGVRKEYSTLRTKFNAIDNELSSMQTALTKFRELATGKKDTILSLEAELQRLRESKNRLELNRFAERQVIETKRGECENLRKQRDTSAQAIAQLKESEASLKLLTTNLEKQVSEYREQLTGLTESNRVLEMRVNEMKMAKDTLAGQVGELAKSMATKDSALAQAKHSQRDAETEVAGLKAKVADAKKKLEEWRSKSSIDPNDQVEMLRVCLFSFL